MYYLITGDMSSYFGYGDREETIIYKHQGTYCYRDLDDARLEGQKMINSGEIESWVVLGPQTNGSTWTGLVYNDSDDDIAVSDDLVMRKREGYDPLTNEILPWESAVQ